MRKILLAASSMAVIAGLLLTPGVVSASTTTVSHAPMVRAKLPTSTHGNGGHGSTSGSSSLTYGWASSNWSGYAISGGTYTDITGSWIVPSVKESRKGSAYSSTWIGIDGFNNSDLIQTGTEQDSSNGSTQYYAWWEILPAAETQITTASGQPATVNPGDNMYAHIKDNNNGTWTITIQDQTKGWTFTTTQNYTGPGSSAEWIEEAPTIGGHVATLANYGEVTIDPGTVNGGNPGFTSKDLGVMEQKNTAVSVPSLPDGDTDGFNATYGSTQPAAPQS